jgi:D-methionine transport system ATP-binding protein
MQTELPESFADLKFSQTPSRDADLVLQIWFFGSVAANPIVSDLVRKFDVDVNILAAHIDNIRSTPFGTLIMQLTGKDKEGVIEFLMDMKLRVEVKGYVVRASSDITY